MTSQTRSALKLVFEDGDTLTGTNFSDLIDSFVNLLDSGTQTVSGTISAGALNAGTATVGAIVVSGAVSAASGFFGTTSVGTETVTTSNATTINATTLNATSVSAQSIYVSGRSQYAVVIASAAGVTQGTATALGVQRITRLQGVTDGSATGFRLSAPVVGTEQVLINDTAVSANLWPSSGCAIDGGSADAVRGIAANARIIVWHTGVSAYSTMRGT